MYSALKDDFSKLMQVLEGKEAYVTVLEDKLREVDYEVYEFLSVEGSSNNNSNFYVERFKCLQAFLKWP